MIVVKIRSQSYLCNKSARIMQNLLEKKTVQEKGFIKISKTLPYKVLSTK